MTENMWTSTPAGVLGQGGADARPFVVAVGSAQAPVAVRQGSGLPATRLRGLDVAGLPAGPAVAGIPAIGSSCTPRGEYTAQFHGTTLGFHPSSRPLS